MYNLFVNYNNYIISVFQPLQALSLMETNDSAPSNKHKSSYTTTQL